MSRAINSRKYTSRPPASCRGARKAWDLFAAYESDRLRAKPPTADAPARTIVGMVRTHMDYWVWVMEYSDGEYDEIDAIELRD